MGFLAKGLDRFLNVVSTDIAIDLGTANVLVYVKEKGVVLNEPTIVAINRKTGQLVAVGQEAKAMLGRTPQHVEVIRPLVEGVISDFEVTEEMLAYLINKVQSEVRTLITPRILIGVPSGITNVEMRAASDAAKNAGARDVFLIEEPMAAAIGAKLPIGTAGGTMIVDIGGGTTDIAVISLNGIVVSKNLRTAGDHLNASIVSYVRDQFKVYIGDKTAEEVKINLSSLEGGESNNEMVIRGRDVITGLPREVIVTSSDVHNAIMSHLDNILEAIKAVLEKTPPEVLSDVMQKGIHLCGGGALISGFSRFLEEELKVPVLVVPDPLRSVIRGLGIVVENFEQYEEILVDNEGELSSYNS